MNRYSVQLIGRDKEGRVAHLQISGEAEWIPLNIEDVEAVKNFKPEAIPEMAFYKDGQKLYGWGFVRP